MQARAGPKQVRTHAVAPEVGIVNALNRRHLRPRRASEAVGPKAH